jgi:hypothetical protein
MIVRLLTFTTNGRIRWLMPARWILPARLATSAPRPSAATTGEGDTVSLTARPVKVDGGHKVADRLAVTLDAHDAVRLVTELLDVGLGEPLRTAGTI